ncbi:MAG: sigma-70 family RNA polymerase sigma factor [Janthinobacterium lividum]
MLEQKRDLVDLMDRVAARDRIAFEDLYRATSAKLYGIVVGILARRSLADEVLQEIYVRIWERAGDFDAGKGSPIAWMATVARNRALDEVRRAKAAPMLALPEGFDVAAETENPLEAMEGSDQLRALMACLDQLDGEKREAVLLAYYRGCSREALSQRYGRPVPTIKTWLHRSLTQLRLCLRQ